MGTKINPGKFDCYAKLEPDEPYFLFRAKDPSGPYLTDIWRLVRQGRFSEAHAALKVMEADLDVRARISTEEYEKLTEAADVAIDMRDWRLRKLEDAQQLNGETTMAGELTVRHPDGSKT